MKITGSDKYFVYDNIVYEIMENTDNSARKEARLFFFPKGHQTNGKPTTDLKILEVINHNGENYKITVIGDFAFFACKYLNSVTASSVQTIGDYAFERCKNLINKNMPNVKTQ